MTDLTAITRRLDLEQLPHRYAKARDTTESTTYREVFTRAATIVIGGRVVSHSLDEILAKVAGDQERFNPEYAPGETHWAKMAHSVTNVLVHDDATHPSAEYLVLTYAYRDDLKRPELMSIARNTDQYAFEDGRWRIAESRIAYSWENEEMGRLLEVGPFTPERYRRG